VIDSIAANNNGRILLTGGTRTQVADAAKLRSQAADAKRARCCTTTAANSGECESGHDRPYKNTHVTGDVRIRRGVLEMPPSENKNLVGSGDPALFSVIDNRSDGGSRDIPFTIAASRNLRMDVNLSVDRDVFVRLARL